MLRSILYFDQSFKEVAAHIWSLESVCSKSAVSDPRRIPEEIAKLQNSRILC